MTSPNSSNKGTLQKRTQPTRRKVGGHPGGFHLGTQPLNPGLLLGTLLSLRDTCQFEAGGAFSLPIWAGCVFTAWFCPFMGHCIQQAGSPGRLPFQERQGEGRPGTFSSVRPSLMSPPGSQSLGCRAATCPETQGPLAQFHRPVAQGPENQALVLICDTHTSSGL